MQEAQAQTRTVNVGLIGLGTVGGGVARLIARHHDEYLAAYGIDLNLARACGLEPERAAELGLAEGVFTTDWHEVVADPAVDIVVELIGGEHPATEIFEAALTSGKHMVSANKALLGRHVERLAALAVEQALELRYCVPLLGIARMTEQGIDARVHPTMIPADHMLASVSGAMNAVYVVGDAVGETMFYGAGAGSFPTASAVVGDILELAGPIAHGDAPAPEREPFARVAPVRSIDDLETRYYIRLAVADRVGALAPVVAAFAEAGISISAINQLVDGATGGDADGACSVVFLTHNARERDVHAVCEALETLDEVERVASVIRIEDVDAWSEGAEAND